MVLSEVRLEGLDTVELSLPSSSSAQAEAPSSPSSPKPPPTPPARSSHGEGEPSASLRLENFPVKLVLEREAEFDAFRGLDGVWGIAGRLPTYRQ